jgi:hypothetical protein
MKLPALVRDSLAEARLGPMNADEEAWWASAKPKMWRRQKLFAAVKGGVFGLVFAVAKTWRIFRGDFDPQGLLLAIVIGVVIGFLSFGFFLFFHGNQAMEAERKNFLKARRLHRAILAEGDAE